MVAQGRETSQDEMDGADLQRHPAEQHSVVSGQRGAAEQAAQHVERQRRQHVR